MATDGRIKTNTRRKTNVNHIDNIAEYSSQPRSSPPKRRTDFSTFSFSSPCNPGSSLGSSCGRDGLSNVTVNSLNKGKGKIEELTETSPVRCNKSKEKGLRISSKFSDVPEVEVESVGQDARDHFSRSVSQPKSNAGTRLNFIPKESQAAERNGLGMTPGSVVWAKTALQIWWPAEIMGERSTLADSINQCIDGHVLVQFYGNNKSAWVDPASDLSQLEDSFEERSCNPKEDFQLALKKALDRKDQVRSCRQLFGSPDTSQAEEERSSDKLILSTSSITEEDCHNTRRSNRERKRKVHFDEVTFPLKSAKKLRRFKIMRHLGLMAPIGSPF